MLLICAFCLILISFSADTAEQDTSILQPEEANQESTDEDNADEDYLVCEHTDTLAQDKRTGITILTGNVRLKMSNGFLNADKVTLYRDVDTGEFIKTVAEGRVEMQEAGALATGDHAVLDHIEDIVNLHDNVVVIQDEDRLESKHATFNRRTGIQTAEGDPVKITRPDGFLNADKVDIYKDLETGEITKIVADEHVEMRDGDIFATSDHAILNQVDDTVDLRGDVVVLQEEDRLEAEHFTFNRRTGKRTGKGDVRFRVRISQKEQPLEETEEADNIE